MFVNNAIAILLLNDNSIITCNIAFLQNLIIELYNKLYRVMVVVTNCGQATSYTPLHPG